MKHVLLINPPMHFDGRGRPHALEVSSPHLGLLYLASYVHRHDARFRVHYVDVAPEELKLAKVVRIARELGPFAVGISVTTPQLQGAYELAVELRKALPRTTRFFAGGAHVSSDPGFVSRNPGLFDFAMTGDAEITFLASLQALARGEEPPLLQKSAPIEDVDAIPFPDRSLIRPGAYNGDQTVMMSRGCPYDCYFCSSPIINRKVRTRSARNVVEELKACHLGRGGRFTFADDTFTIRRKRVLEFCEQVRAERLPLRWNANARIDLVDDEMLAAMKSAGCEWAQFGVEAGNEAIRKKVVQKGFFTNADVRRVIAMCKRHGIRVGAYMILGHPGETKAEVQETKDMIFGYGWDGVSTGVLLPLPGTEVWNMAKRDGVVSDEMLDRFARKEFGEGYGGSYPLYLPHNLEPEYLFSEMRDINRRFYLNVRQAIYRLRRNLTSPRKLRLDARNFLRVLVQGGSSVRPFTGYRKYWRSAS
ncbi:MAG: B12-binding domain-containing radical SAM protein [Myxococcota bacterium]